MTLKQLISLYVGSSLGYCYQFNKQSTDWITDE